MKTSQRGVDLIKSFEGCRLTAYKPVPTEKYWTIGYGHYGPDVIPGVKITQLQAEQYLKKDLEKFESAVTKTGLDLNQNEFDALVSFAYNCGAGNLNKLVSGRTKEQIAEKMLSYNKGGGKVLAGLTRRRNSERALFLTACGSSKASTTSNEYKEPTELIKKGSVGNGVKWVQTKLNKLGYDLKVDGICGDQTVIAIMQFQFYTGLVLSSSFSSLFECDAHCERHCECHSERHASKIPSLKKIPILQAISAFYP